jgi:Flp pilus assembly protein TadD
MAEKRLRVSGYLPIMTALFALVLFACSCSTPRIVILKDPLSAKEHNDLGVAYEQKGMPGLAEEEYKKATEKQNNWVIPSFNLGNLFYKQGDLKRAEGYYRKALAIDENNPDVLNNLANLLHEEGRREEAKDLIERALAIRKKEEYLDTYRRIIGVQK